MTRGIAAKITQDETITAIATPVGVGGVGMVRLSGAAALDIAKQIFRTSGGVARDKFESHKVNYGFVVDGNGEKIDEVLLTVMLSPLSYTREDVVEVSCHGGNLVCRKIMERVLSAGARIAQPGEFSKRAFLNGRIDLVQAEAIIDLIESKSGKGWKTAFSQLDGKLSETLSSIERRLVAVVADLEASIDFPDEELEIANDQQITSALSELHDEIDRLIRSYDTGRIYRMGLSVAITGRPNVGKSSLMNALLQQDRVIVTDTPGTTRDMVEETLHIDGIETRIIDTAGIRETSEPVEKLGVERAMTAALDSDIVLMVLDGSEEIMNDDIKLIDTLSKQTASLKLIPIINKCDLEQKLDTASLGAISKDGTLFVSATTFAGLDNLKTRIAGYAMGQGEPLGEGRVLTRERHVEKLNRMILSIDRALKTTSEGLSREFTAADLADAKGAIEELTGKVFDEQVLQNIFESFCVGK